MKQENALLPARFPMSNKLYYKVNEVFTTIQGEGSFAGHPAVFIRLQGCDVGCGFCDTKQTWDDKEESYLLENSNDVFKKVQNQNETEKQLWGNVHISELMSYVCQQLNVGLVVITGGEPCLQNISPLIDAIEETGRTVQIETSGTEIVKCNDKTWVTVSPKIEIGNMKPIVPQAIERANEIKYVCGAIQHLEKLDALIMQYKPTAKIYLQPLSILPKATEICVSEAIKRGWLVSIQTHKYINIR